jgi:hypothetical protein
MDIFPSSRFSELRYLQKIRTKKNTGHEPVSRSTSNGLPGLDGIGGYPGALYLVTLGKPVVYVADPERGCLPVFSMFRTPGDVSPPGGKPFIFANTTLNPRIFIENQRSASNLSD